MMGSKRLRLNADTATRHTRHVTPFLVGRQIRDGGFLGRKKVFIDFSSTSRLISAHGSMEGGREILTFNHGWKDVGRTFPVTPSVQNYEEFLANERIFHMTTRPTLEEEAAMDPPDPILTPRHEDSHSSDSD